jgi:uncharacterized glyoxalase superfamily protein PhnB
MRKSVNESSVMARSAPAPARRHFSLSLAEEAYSNGAIIYFEHERLDEWVLRLKAAGIAIEQDPVDQPYLWREAVLRDPSGNRIKLYRAGRNRRHPPWRVDRRG